MSANFFPGTSRLSYSSLSEKYFSRKTQFFLASISRELQISLKSVWRSEKNITERKKNMKRKQDSLPENRGLEDLKLVNEDVYRRTTSTIRAYVARCIYFQRAYCCDHKESRHTHYRGGTRAFLPREGRELSFAINTNGGANWKLPFSKNIIFNFRINTHTHTHIASRANGRANGCKSSSYQLQLVKRGSTVRVNSAFNSVKRIKAREMAFLLARI